jgi:hypothetical protein
VEARRRRAEGATLKELAESYDVGLATISRRKLPWDDYFSAMAVAVAVHVTGGSGQGLAPTLTPSIYHPTGWF